MIAVNKNGESLPVLTPITPSVININGTAGAVASNKLPESTYRLEVTSSVGDAGLFLTVTAAGTVATSINSLHMGQGSVEYFAIPEGMIISVLNGLLNIVPVN